MLKYNIKSGTMSYRRKDEHRRELRRSFGKNETDGETWLLDDMHEIWNVKGRRCASQCYWDLTFSR
jgi:hypothetical protein